MPTYASPRLTRIALSTSLTITFLIGGFIFMYAIVHTINTVSTVARRERLPNDEGDERPQTGIEEFPSTSAPTTELVIGGVTLFHSILGIIGVNLERPHLLSVHAYVLLMSCVIKLLLVVASTSMHIVASGTEFWTFITQLTLASCLLEVVLIFCGCQYAKLLKRGDAARQEIQSLHSYHLERRSRSRSFSRSRSMSRARSVYGSRVLPAPGYTGGGGATSKTPSRWATPSLAGVRYDELILQPFDRCFYDEETDTYIVPPPPIFLELDR